MNPKEQAKLMKALQGRDWPVAERLLRKRVGGAKATADDHFNLGVVFAEQGRWRYALTALKRAVKRAPSNPVFHLQLARAALEEKDLPTAAEAFGRAWRLRPDDRAARLNYGKLALRLGDWAAARDALKVFQEPDVRALAYRAAAELGEEGAAEDLRDLLANQTTRNAAVNAMAKTAKGRFPLKPAYN